MKTSLCIKLLVSLAGVTLSVSAAQPSITLIVVEGQKAFPVVKYEPSTHRFEEIPERFALPPKSTYPLYQNGRKMGVFQAEKITPSGCSDFPQLTGKTHLLSSQQQPKFAQPSFLTYLSYTPEESKRLALSPAPKLNSIGESLKQQVLSKTGRKNESMSFVITTVNSFVFQKGKGQKLEEGIFIAARHHRPSGVEACETEAFWALGIMQAGIPVLLKQMSTPFSASEEECKHSNLVSSFSIDQTLDHVIIQHNGYEWWNYRIYDWQKDNWKEVFYGGGGGC
jgi:hypothetical protein